MEILLALTNYTDQNQPVTVSLDHHVEFPSSKYFVKESGSGFVCAHDYTKAVLFEVAKDCFTIVGVFFFRRSGSQHAFSLATLHGIADFEASSSPRTPTPSADTHIVLSAKHLIDQVEFFSDTLVIGTVGGSLGIILFREPKQLKGCFVERNVGLKGPYRWGFACNSSLCALVSKSSIAVYAYQQDKLDAEPEYTAEIQVNDISSVLLLKQQNGAYLSLLIHYTTSQDLTLLTLSLADRSTFTRETILLPCQPPNSPYFLASEPQSFVRGTQNAHIVAILLPGCIHFGTIREAKFETYTAAPNELNVPFEFGHWNTRRSYSSNISSSDDDSSSCFAAVRRNCICIIYNVKERGDMIEEICLTHRIILPFSGFCFSPFQESKGILSVGHCDLVCSPAESNASVQVQGSLNDVFLPLQGVGFLEESASLLLLEVVQTEVDYAFLCLLKNGDCLLALYGVKGTKHVAFEEKPYEVSSMLYFVREEKIFCTLGFHDGMLKLFSEGKLLSAVHTSHCGPIDRLTTLHNFYANYTEAMFISISSCMGTVCLHSADVGEVSQTFVSPSRPLTSCYLDQSSEYLFTFSRPMGNLWHLPSCSLERTFIVTEEFDFQANLTDLLAKPWTSSMRITTLNFLGRRHFSVYINIEKLIESMQKDENPLLSLPPSTSLLLDCCVGTDKTSPFLTDAKLYDVLEDTSLKVSGSCDICVNLGSMRLVHALFDSSKEAQIASGILEMSMRLCKNFFSKCRGESGSSLDYLLCDYFFAFFTDLQFISATARYGFEIFVRDLTPESVLELSQNLLSDRMLTYQGSHKVETSKIPFSENKMYALVGALLVESGVHLEPKSACEIHQLLLTPVIESVRRWFASPETEPISFDSSMALLAFSEGFPIFAEVLYTPNLVHQLIQYAIKGTCEKSRRVCIQAVSRIISHNTARFVDDYCAELSVKHPRWNAALIKIFEFYTVNFPNKAFYVCDYLLDFSIKLIGKNSAADKKDIIVGAFVQFARTLASLLPNVSFQNHSQRIAVGTSEGIVKVYSVKNEGVATSFKAHSEPILSLAFSKNKTDYELVVVSQGMKYVSIWKTPPQSISLVSLFTRSSRKFRHFADVDLPNVENFVATELLSVRFCRVRWVSPECIQFVSPWHGKIQVAV
ncbi:unnamed protein product [Phytomonas sp. EM1]|nr:unnamed protein product [Phytomonas sp. EM1]|eukprot:CCW64507.1 unnamed protein product [Phytomonas sp. isolate EM1]